MSDRLKSFFLWLAATVAGGIIVRNVEFSLEERKGHTVLENILSPLPDRAEGALRSVISDPFWQGAAVVGLAWCLHELTLLGRGLIKTQP
jgi:hypothetical protein